MRKLPPLEQRISELSSMLSRLHDGDYIDPGSYRYWKTTVEDAQRLTGLVEGLKELAGGWRGLHCECCTLHTDQIDTILLAHGFAPEVEVPREAPQEAANGVPSTETDRGSLGP